ncbi:MAG TPA: tetratricopeptide repeat protein [Gammaproteobacteria bacterium]|nr:tetratricopeptide repeat protein [Gammaproteobacteria bacterium]
MNEYETEEQQLEALKKWWKENGTSLIVGLVVGVSALFGWRAYVQQNNAHAVQASDLYMQAIQSMAMQPADEKLVDVKAIDINNKLINEYTDTPYAALSSLALAKVEYEKGDVDSAIAQMELAVKHASDNIIKQIANLRLARLYIEQKKYSEASAILDMPHDTTYDAQFEELKGDVFSAKGDVAEARMAYDRAITLQGGAASKWLKLKRQNLGA